MISVFDQQQLELKIKKQNRFCFFWWNAAADECKEEFILAKKELRCWIKVIKKKEDEKVSNWIIYKHQFGEIFCTEVTLLLCSFRVHFKWRFNWAIVKFLLKLILHNVSCEPFQWSNSETKLQSWEMFSRILWAFQSTLSLFIYLSLI